MCMGNCNCKCKSKKELSGDECNDIVAKIEKNAAKNAEILAARDIIALIHKKTANPENLSVETVLNRLADWIEYKYIVRNKEGTK